MLFVRNREIKMIVDDGNQYFATSRHSAFQGLCEVLREAWGDPVPHHMRLGVAVKQKKRRASAAVAGPNHHLAGVNQ